jgi:hypothetical protein
MMPGHMRPTLPVKRAGIGGIAVAADGNFETFARVDHGQQSGQPPFELARDLVELKGNILRSKEQARVYSALLYVVPVKVHDVAIAHLEPGVEAAMALELDVQHVLVFGGQGALDLDNVPLILPRRVEDIRRQ